ncbi:hypothetical protein [Sphingopyxis fribergensis]|uniref:hypothetical protein n=1 Tax=Sphingopyxis fribergensis TaxID=1515612 RepID=UPI00057E29A1|nr:hypothetical protein [Sphingopyxis fribergensis]
MLPVLISGAAPSSAAMPWKPGKLAAGRFEQVADAGLINAVDERADRRFKAGIFADRADAADTGRKIDLARRTRHEQRRGDLPQRADVGPPVFSSVSPVTAETAIGTSDSASLRRVAVTMMVLSSVSAPAPCAVAGVANRPRTSDTPAALMRSIWAALRERSFTGPALLSQDLSMWGGRSFYRKAKERGETQCVPPPIA